MTGFEQVIGAVSHVDRVGGGLDPTAVRIADARSHDPHEGEVWRALSLDSQNARIKSFASAHPDVIQHLGALLSHPEEVWQQPKPV